MPSAMTGQIPKGGQYDALLGSISPEYPQGGKDDPNITLIKVIPSEGYYWDTKHGTAVAFLKMAASVVIGKTMDDSVEGSLDID